MRKIIAVIGIALLLSGCQTVKDVATPFIADTKPPLHMTDPAPVTVNPVKWHVITEKNSADVLKQVQATGQPPAVVALTPDDFQNLTIELGQFQKYLDDMKKQLDTYKKYYEPPATISPDQNK